MFIRATQRYRWGVWNTKFAFRLLRRTLAIVSTTQFVTRFGDPPTFYSVNRNTKKKIAVDCTIVIRNVVWLVWTSLLSAWWYTFPFICCATHTMWCYGAHRWKSANCGDDGETFVIPSEVAELWTNHLKNSMACLYVYMYVYLVCALSTRVGCSRLLLLVLHICPQRQVDTNGRHGDFD